MAFMARLRTAADESPHALRITFMSWLRPVRRKCKRAAAVSAVAAARRGRNGGLLTLRRFACEQRVRVAGKAADRAQRHMADDAGDAEIFIVDQRAGELLVGREIGANEARHVIDGAADLPALDDLVDRGEPLLRDRHGGVTVPGLQRTTSCCAAPGTRQLRAMRFRGHDVCKQRTLKHHSNALSSTGTV